MLEVTKITFDDGTVVDADFDQVPYTDERGQKWTRIHFRAPVYIKEGTMINLKLEENK